jgi:hypothetical protein
MITQSLCEYVENGGTPKGYYDQFVTVKPEIGKVYINNAENWMAHEFLITYVDDVVALGVCLTENTSIKRELFYSSGLRAGWKYGDNRPTYRLSKERFEII